MRKLQLALPQSTRSAEPLVGSPEQVDIWDEMVRGLQHLMVNAVAGSGKSTTCIEGARRVKEHHPSQVLYLAFNKHIQTEMESRADGCVQAKTFHSLGLDAIKARTGAVQIDDKRMWKLIDNLKEWLPGERVVMGGLKQLSGVAKQYDAGTPGELERLIDIHGLDLGSESEQDATVHLMPQLMEKASQFTRGQVAVIDFDDMCWLPKRLDLPIRPADMALIDESQDLNHVQQWMAVRAGERLVIVGDRNQAIYGFRGSDVMSMDNLAAQCRRYKVLEFPLTATRRCPASHVRLAQTVVPWIQALPDAIEGHYGVRSTSDIVSMAGPGEMILCRTNAPLIGMAHKLIALGKRVVIKGRDVGGAILRLLEQAANQQPTLLSALAQARVITDYDVNRFLLMENNKGQMRASMAEDRLECLLSAAEGCLTIEQLKQKLKALFADDGDSQSVITLGTIHRMKGLESSSVTILKPELMPHPLATRPADIQQEMNCLYVALTRSRRDLWFENGLPRTLEKVD